MARRRKLVPDPPELPDTLDPAPGHLESGDVWDGVEATADVGVPEQLADVRIQESRWTGADLSGRTLNGLRVRDTEFVSCDLSGAALSGAVLSRVTFTGCRLTGAVFRDAKLTDVRISRGTADLTAFPLTRASYLLVEDTSLREADLHGFRATDCALLNCDLTGADIEAAALAGTDLHGSTLDEVRGALALRGCRIASEQLVPVGAALLDALGITITERS